MVERKSFPTDIPALIAIADKRGRAIREAVGLLCPYCRDGWAMVPSLGHMRFEKHVYPKDYKGMRAGMGPGCQAHRIREILGGE